MPVRKGPSHKWCLAVLSALLACTSGSAIAQLVTAERLDRGVVAVPASGGTGILVSWRDLSTDPAGTTFILYREGVPVTPAPISATNFLDAAGTSRSRYTVAAVASGQASVQSPEGLMAAAGYLNIPLDRPPPRTAPDGTAYGYEANDVSAGDLDGDGRYELIVKWYPSIAKDNAFGGYTGNTLLDAYTLEGQRLWRIDMGPNIRSGAHYTQFMVFDFDGDGRAELAAKTADGTIDGAGNVIGDVAADWVEDSGEVPTVDRTGSIELPDGRRVAQLRGRVLKGPEFLTVFDGLTGRALATEPYDPPRHPDTANPSADQLRIL